LSIGLVLGSLLGYGLGFSEGRRRAQIDPLTSGQPTGGVTQSAAKEPGFDPDDVEATFRWLVGRYEHLEEVEKRRNEMATADAKKEFAAVLDGIKGKDVRWRLHVYSVSENGIVLIGPKYPPSSSDAESFLRAAIMAQGGAPVYTSGFSLYPEDPPGKGQKDPGSVIVLKGPDDLAWAKQYGKGDSLTVRGRIDKVVFVTSGGGFRALGFHFDLAHVRVER
jgi:hypothetical protein